MPRGEEDHSVFAFGLVCGAGLSTCLGAVAVYNTQLVALASKKVLAAGLSLSAGVMLYVSFVEIFYKSVDYFREHATAVFPERSNTEQIAHGFATLCFFSGILMMKLIDAVVHMLRSVDGKQLRKKNDALRPQDIEIQITDAESSDVSGEGCPNTRAQISSSHPTTVDIATPPPSVGPCICHTNETTESIFREMTSSDKEETFDREARKKLVRMGLNTALAIGIHNFPEGLATFIATLDSPQVGVPLAVAIAIHNIPEGLCVAIPIFYATGSRHQAFMWAFLSGISEPIGAALGWLVLSNADNTLTFAIAFGLIAGMMVAIVAHELLPTAHRYDPKDEVATNMFILGMVVMSISLILFK